MSLKEAFNHTTVFDKTSKKQMAWGNNVYKKYKDLVLNNLDEETIDKYLPNGIQKSLFFRTYK